MTVESPPPQAQMQSRKIVNRAGYHNSNRTEHQEYSGRHILCSAIDLLNFKQYLDLRGELRQQYAWAKARVNENLAGRDSLVTLPVSQEL
jgi:hypothetical protein